MPEEAKAGSILTRKIGPAPLWVYMAVGAAGVASLLLKSKSGNKASAPTTVPSQSDLGSAASGDGGGGYGGGAGYFDYGGQLAFNQCPNGEIVSDPSLCGGTPPPAGGGGGGTPPPPGNGSWSQWYGNMLAALNAGCPQENGQAVVSFSCLTDALGSVGQMPTTGLPNLPLPPYWILVAMEKSGMDISHYCSLNPAVCNEVNQYNNSPKCTSLNLQSCAGSGNSGNTPNTTVNGSNGPQSSNADMHSVSEPIPLPSQSRKPIIGQNSVGASLAGARL